MQIRLTGSGYLSSVFVSLVSYLQRISSQRSQELSMDSERKQSFSRPLLAAACVELELSFRVTSSSSSAPPPTPPAPSEQDSIFCVVHLGHSCPAKLEDGGDLGGGTWFELGRTEAAPPDGSGGLTSWETKIPADFGFEEGARQTVRLEVFRSAAPEGLGVAEASLAQLVRAGNTALNCGPAADILVKVREVFGGNDLVQLQLSAADLEYHQSESNLIGANPFYVLSKARRDQKHLYCIVHHGEVISCRKRGPQSSGTAITWKPLNIPLRELCDGDPERAIKVDIYDHDQDGSHELVGSFCTNLVGLRDAMKARTPFEVVNPFKASSSFKKNKKYHGSGKAFVKYFEVIQKHSFVDYLQGGTNIELAISVDFTASNGDPCDDRSLHFRPRDGRDNQYTHALRVISGVLQDYSDKKQFACFGFGAKLNPRGEARHDFNLNLKEKTEDSLCKGVQGVLDAYDLAQRSVEQYGPSCFAPTINNVIQMASRVQDGSQYYVMLILTDGVITDTEETAKAIVASSALPMSIIILGIGDENFSSMEQLFQSDHGAGLLDTVSHKAARSNVSLVEMKHFIVSKFKYEECALARAVLHEVPKQMVEWMTFVGLKPLNS